MSNDHQRLRVITTGPAAPLRRTTVEVDGPALYHRAPRLSGSGGNLWLFYDIRQYTQQRAQHLLPDDGLVVTGPAGTTWTGAMLAEGRSCGPSTRFPSCRSSCTASTSPVRAARYARARRSRSSSGRSPRALHCPRTRLRRFTSGWSRTPVGALRFEHAPGEKYHYYHPRDVQLSVLQSNPLTIAAGAATQHPRPLPVPVHRPHDRPSARRGRLRQSGPAPQSAADRPKLHGWCQVWCSFGPATHGGLVSRAEDAAVPRRLGPGRGACRRRRVRCGDCDQSEQLSEPQQPGAR